MFLTDLRMFCVLCNWLNCSLYQAHGVKNWEKNVLNILKREYRRLKIIDLMYCHADYANLPLFISSIQYMCYVSSSPLPVILENSQILRNPSTITGSVLGVLSMIILVFVVIFIVRRGKRRNSKSRKGMYT